jgi:hypothetical protein
MCRVLAGKPEGDVGVDRKIILRLIFRKWDVGVWTGLGPGAHPASFTMGTVSFPGVKPPGRGADHTPPSIAEVTKG